MLVSGVLEKKKTLHVITGLQVGGAEMMLYNLLSGIDPNKYESHVICLSKDGPLGRKIRELGVGVSVLGAEPNFSVFPKIVETIRFVIHWQPQIMHGWMYHACLISSIASLFSPPVQVVWGIHHSSFDANTMKRTTRFISRLLAVFSYFAVEKIQYCSAKAKLVHERIGYRRTPAIIIPNGVEINKFRPDARAGEGVRQELGIDKQEFVIGMVARYHAQKDFANFIVAAAHLISVEKKPVRFVLVGEQVSWENHELARIIDNRDLQDYFLLLGVRHDISNVMNAFNILSVSSSAGEALPLTLLEAMASCVPCVATDVGDAKDTIGDTGLVVAPKSSRELAAAWKEMIDLPQDQITALGVEARKRVATHFELREVIKLYDKLYISLSDSL